LEHERNRKRKRVPKIDEVSFAKLEMNLKRGYGTNLPSLAGQQPKIRNNWVIFKNISKAVKKQ
jgi:hypothetical protein